jgi:hypothetical protein
MIVASSSISSSPVVRPFEVLPRDLALKPDDHEPEQVSAPSQTGYAAAVAAGSRVPEGSVPLK